MGYPLKTIFSLDSSLVKREYFMLLAFLAIAILLAVLIIGASYFLAIIKIDTISVQADKIV